MIRVKVELVSGAGRRKRITEIARIEIDNVTGDGPVADYHVSAMVQRPDGDAGIHHRTILNHPRRSLNVLGLLTAALVALGYDPMKASDDAVQPDIEG